MNLTPPGINELSNRLMERVSLKINGQTCLKESVDALSLNTRDADQSLIGLTPSRDIEGDGPPN